MYDLTLADLSFAGTRISVSLVLYGCPHFTISTVLEKPLAFASYVGTGKTVGAGYLEFSRRRTPPPMTRKLILVDARRHVLAKTDPMYRVATDYVEHQMMREFVRRSLAEAGTKPEMQFLMAALSVWLILHDPIRANFIRQQTLETFRNHQRACFTVGCTSNRAYVSHVGDTHIDLTDALQTAENSTEPGVILQPRIKTPTSDSIH